MPEPEAAPTAPPNDLPVERLKVSPSDEHAVAIDPSRAGWRYLSFRTAVVRGGQALEVGGADETAVVPIAGEDLTATAGGATVTLPGRPGPFDRLPAAWYLPPGVAGTLAASRSSGTTLVAIASAPASGRDGVATQPRLIMPRDVRIEIRGAGNATRQINHIVTPEFPADRLEVVEVLTPSGNWSSWPPHKHDVDDMPTEAVLEEIYYYRFRRPEAWGIQRLYRRPGSPAYLAGGPRDALLEVRTDDVVLVTDGYHPFVAAHGDDAWYLNALAGDRRTMACSFDPDLAWVRESWREIEPDPRVPLIRD